jgi:hypothetical protein
MEQIPPEVLLDDVPTELGRIGHHLRRLVHATLPARH